MKNTNLQDHDSVSILKKTIGWHLDAAITLCHRLYAQRKAGEDSHSA